MINIYIYIYIYIRSKYNNNRFFTRNIYLLKLDLLWNLLLDSTLPWDKNNKEEREREEEQLSVKPVLTSQTRQISVNIHLLFKRIALSWLNSINTSINLIVMYFTLYFLVLI